MAVKGPTGVFFRHMNIPVSSLVLAVTGILTVPSFLLQRNLFFQIMQVASFLVLTGAMGKRIRLLPPVIMFISITVLNLFTPIGKVIFSFAGITITLGAVRLGMMKALTLIGLIYLSRGTVRPDLKLPGKFGGIITRTFYYFDQIHETWNKIPKQPIISRLDNLIDEIYAAAEQRQTKKPQTIQSRPVGIFLMIIFLGFHWTLFSLQYVLSWDLIQRTQ